MAVEIGKSAPKFSLLSQHEEKIALKDQLGSKVVLYFYPKDMTPGCTKQAEMFRDHLLKIKKKNAKVIGISRDSLSRHQKFAQKYDLNFDLLSDEKGTVCEKYHVWQEKKMYGKVFMGIIRTTFIIDEKGKISHIFTKVKVAIHLEQVLNALSE